MAEKGSAVLPLPAAPVFGGPAPQPLPADQEKSEYERQRAVFDQLLADQKKTESQPKPPAPVKEKKAAKAAEPALEAPKAPEPPKEDPAFAELKAKAMKLEADIAELRAAKTPTPEPEPEPEDELDVSALVQHFGEDEAKAVLSAIKAAVEPWRSKVEALESLIDQARAQGTKNISEQNQLRLSEKIPQLKNEKAWQIIEREVRAAFEKDAKAYPTPEAAFDAISKELYGEMDAAPAKPVEAESDEPSDKEMIANAAPTVRTRREKPSRPTADQAAWAAYKHLVKNPDDVVGASRLASRAMIES